MPLTPNQLGLALASRCPTQHKRHSKWMESSFILFYLHRETDVVQRGKFGQCSPSTLNHQDILYSTFVCCLWCSSLVLNLQKILRERPLYIPWHLICLENPHRHMHMKQTPRTGTASARKSILVSISAPPAVMTVNSR